VGYVRSFLGAGVAYILGKAQGSEAGVGSSQK
jgi:hypothetical protein